MQRPVPMDPDAQQDLAAARAATAQFHDVDNAVAADYIPTEDCVFSPFGTMGLHFVNLGLIADGVIDLEKPEVLIYLPSEDGVRLAAIEYLFAIGPPGGAIPDPAPPAPVLFGETFNGPMLGHGGGPPHYDLHVWTWQANPDGIFEDWNTKVSC